MEHIGSVHMSEDAVKQAIEVVRDPLSAWLDSKASVGSTAVCLVCMDRVTVCVSLYTVRWNRD